MKMYGWGFHLRALRKAHDKLEAENKALEEEMDEVRNAGIGTLFELRRVQGSRDELLEACDGATSAFYDSLHGGNSNYTRLSVSYARSTLNKLESVIQKAKAVKEKETK